MSSGPKKPLTWRRWCHNDTTTLNLCLKILVGVSFEIIGLQLTVFEIFALMSFRLKKAVTWLRWRHNDITSRKTMVTLVRVSFEIIVLQRAVSEIFVLTSSRFEKTGTYLPVRRRLISTSGFRPPCWTRDDPIVGEVPPWSEYVGRSRQPPTPF